MGGKRVAQPEAGQKKRRTGLWIALAAAAAVCLGLVLGVCFYAGGYDAVFPGVSMAEIPLAGLSREAAEVRLEEELPAWVDGGSITVSAGQISLGTYPRSQLGAYAVAGEAAQAVWAVGRESGPLGWLRNGWTMARGLLGGETALVPELYYDENALAMAVGQMAADFDRAPKDGAYQLTREGLFATKHQTGRALDQAALVKLLAGAQGQVEAPWQEIPAQELDLYALAQSLSPVPSPARYDVEQGKVVDGQVGVTMDPEAARLALEAAAEGETIPLPAQITFPEITAQELETVLFRDLLGTATTTVSGSKTRKNNVQLAAAAVNGTILNAGDIFDYNQVVGQRTVERGYGEAATYVNGETVNTVGGGICQVSSTVYLAALLSDLEITERYNHRFYPGYITLGMDATVSWGGPEFRFKNNSDYPIRMDVTYDKGQLTASFYGTNLDGSYVKMTREVLSTTGYETEYVETEELPWGTQKEKQNGYTGYEVESYRNRYSSDGTLISTTFEAKSSYKSRNQIILVGVAGRPEGGLPPSQGTDEPTLPPTGGDTEGEPTPPPDQGGEPTPPDTGAGGVDTTPPDWL